MQRHGWRGWTCGRWEPSLVIHSSWYLYHDCGGWSRCYWLQVWFCGLRQLSLDLVVQLGIKLEALLCPQYWLFRSSSIDCLVPVALVALLLPRWGMLSILKTCMQAAKAFHLFSLKPLYLVVCFPWKLDELTGYFLFFLICSLIIINVHLLVFCWLYNKLSDICKSYWCKLLKYMSIKL
jgi:hypothetical protein